MRSAADREADRRLMCLHEAAHAVVLTIKGGRPSYIEEGACVSDWLPPTAKGQLCYTLAGYSAEMIEEGDESGLTVFEVVESRAVMAIPGADADDYANAIAIVAKAKRKPRQRRRLLEAASAEALQLCKKHWRTIETLALELENALEKWPDATIGTGHLPALLHVGNLSEISQ